MNKVFRVLLVLGVVVNSASFATGLEGGENTNLVLNERKEEGVNPEELKRQQQETLAAILTAVENGPKDLTDDLEKQQEEDSNDSGKTEEATE